MATTLSYAHLEEAVLHLPLEERSRLASRLLESLDEEGLDLSSDWNEELQRRVNEIDEGMAQRVSGEEVAANVRASLAKVRAERQ
jgi:putative addiction module component (TIGR02574 family)